MSVSARVLPRAITVVVHVVPSHARAEQVIDDRRAVRRRRVVQAVRAVFVPSRRVGAAFDEREERGDVAASGGGARVVVGAHRRGRGGERAREWTTVRARFVV